MSLMAGRERGTRVLGSEVNNKTVDLKSTRVDLEWAGPVLSKTNLVEAVLRAYFGQNSRSGSFKN